MSNVINIKTGELAISHNDFILKTGSVGSCLVIILYDKERRIGGLAHAMLPKNSNSEDEVNIDFSSDNTSGKYVDTAIKNLIIGIKQKGGDVDNLEAKLVGGASMFKKLTGDKFGIGFQNIQLAENTLKALNIPIDGEEVGGSAGRSVEFDLKTGRVNINTVL